MRWCSLWDVPLKLGFGLLGPYCLKGVRVFYAFNQGVPAFWVCSAVLWEVTSLF